MPRFEVHVPASPPAVPAPGMRLHSGVASKMFLISIGDRTVGGLTARDQCVGPWQVPVADCAIGLRDYEGYSYQEIGEITGLTESQVKVYIYRARLFLKAYIGQIDSVI